MSLDRAGEEDPGVEAAGARTREATGKENVDGGQHNGSASTSKRLNDLGRPEDATLAPRFKALFAGYDRAYGCYRPPAKRSEAGVKLRGRNETIHAEPTLALFADHLGGPTRPGIGIIPLLDDNRCWWGALDFDVYDGLDHAALAREVAAQKLPLVVCRSKSGGAHLYVFLKQPAPADKVRAELARWAGLLGHEGCEVFPKQSARASPEDVGNWINLPYRAGERRTAFDDLGRELPLLEAFLDYAEARSIHPDRLAELAADATPEPALPGHRSGSRDRERTPKQREGRDGYLFSEACRLLRLGLDRDEIEQRLFKLNDEADADDHLNFAQFGPLTEKEVRQKVKNAIRRYRRGNPTGSEGERPLTDEGNAERFIDQHGVDVRFVYAPRRWLAWTGTHWRWDHGGEVERRAKTTVRAIFDEAKACEDGQRRKELVAFQRKSEGAPAQRNLLALAQKQAEAQLDDLDRDHHLLNVGNGTLDLRTDELREHRREDMITSVLDVGYDPDATSPIWDRFLLDVMGGRREMVDFLRRAIGYSLTGSTQEQCLFLLYGTGRNGKSTFLETIKDLLGGYARTAEYRTVLAMHNDQRVRNDLAALIGRRFVTASEAGRKQRFDEPLVKQLTGGDKVVARFLFKEEIEFRPTFKLWLATNHKPAVDGVDEGIWRRFMLVPWEVEIAPDRVDKDLPEKLRAERAGILAWAERGYREWRSSGLDAPEHVREANRRYRETSDALGPFIADRCETARQLGQPANKVTSDAKELYAAYVEYQDRAAEDEVGKKEFGEMLTERGFPSKTVRVRGEVERHRLGIRLRGEAVPQQKEAPF